jgi:hypothetical protein
VSETLPADPDYARRHVRFGWWSFLLFTALGLALEVFHGFKIRGYLDVSNETRRLMWTLAHAHGSLLALVHVVFGLSIRVVPQQGGANQRLISSCLIAASCALPGGFFLGGVVVHGSDPSLGILLVPIGATALLVAIFQLARRAGSVDPPGRGSNSPPAQKAANRTR